MRKHLLLSAFVGVLPFIGAARTVSPERVEMLKDSLKHALTLNRTSSDSLATLIDIQDLSARRDYDSIGRHIVDIAIQSGNASIGLEALRNLASHNLRSDSMLSVDYSKALLFPDSEERRETLTFISMLQNLHSVRYSTPHEREKQLRKLLREANVNFDDDIYQNIILLHAICLYIAETSNGDLLSSYLDKLGSLIDQLRPEAWALRNSYHVLSALTYNKNEEHTKAIEADRQLLKNIDAIEAGHLGKQRKYHSYAQNRYVALTRLLSNYEYLPLDSVEKYYNTLVTTMQLDTVTAGVNRRSMRPQIYYAMANGRYAQALSILEKAIDFPDNKNHRRRLLKLMITAAEKIGDSKTLLKSSLAYNQALEEALAERAEEKYRELQIAYDVNQVRSEYTHENELIQQRLTRTNIIGGGILFLLLLLTIWLGVYSLRLRHNLKATRKALESENSNLTQSQADLLAAREESQSANYIKAEFIQNMSNEMSGPLHIITEYINLILDCSEADDKPYLRHFADMVTLNADILNATINDMLALSQIDNNKVNLTLRYESLRPLCEAAIESIRHKLSPGVVAIVDPGVPNISINTDAKRLMQILMQLLSNAAKFTQEGEISLNYSVDEDANTVTIRLSDTGIGINPDNAEYIFQRFVKLNKSIQGTGIGLSIARYLADALGGTLYVNTNYSPGAQLVLTLPIN